MTSSLLPLYDRTPVQKIPQSVALGNVTRNRWPWVCVLRASLHGRDPLQQAPSLRVISGVPQDSGVCPERAGLGSRRPSPRPFPLAELGGPAAVRPQLSPHVAYRCLKAGLCDA